MADYALLRLMSWFSPVFPTGGYAYSAGLEQVVAARTMTDAATLRTWIADLLRHGGWRNDLILFAMAWRSAADADAISSTARLAVAMAGSSERHAEALAQGAAFLDAAAHWFDGLAHLPPRETPLCVAAGAVSRLGGVGLEPALGAHVHAIVSGQLQAAIRLSVLGQQGAAALLAALEDDMSEAATVAAASTPDDLGGFAFAADIASMRHETQGVRLFLS